MNTYYDYSIVFLHFVFSFFITKIRGISEKPVQNCCTIRKATFLENELILTTSRFTICLSIRYIDIGKNGKGHTGMGFIFII